MVKGVVCAYKFESPEATVFNTRDPIVVGKAWKDTDAGPYGQIVWEAGVNLCVIRISTANNDYESNPYVNTPTGVMVKPLGGK